MTKPTKTIHISAKCSDLCNVQALDESGNLVCEWDGYVPDFMPDQHYGDYLMLDIDLATGQILNWTPPSDSVLKRDLKNM